jgi:protein-L-isoaspartate(D-aspartate) O-methyltransferase
VNVVVQVLSPRAARRHLVGRLQAAGRITSERVAAAFNTVPRHKFVPAGTSVQDEYADDVVITQRGSDGKTSSSVSAPWLRALPIDVSFGPVRIFER